MDHDCTEASPAMVGMVDFFPVVRGGCSTREEVRQVNTLILNRDTFQMPDDPTSPEGATKGKRVMQ